MNGRARTVEQIIGDRIRARRTQMGLVQEQLAASLGLSYSYCVMSSVLWLKRHA